MLTSSLGLLTTASKSNDGGYAYNSATVPFLAECLKLLVSVYLLRSQMRNNPEVRACASVRTQFSAGLRVQPTFLLKLITCCNSVESCSGRAPI